MNIEQQEKKSFFQWKQANTEKIKRKYELVRSGEPRILDSPTKIDLATQKWTQNLIEAINHGVPLQKPFVKNFTLPRTIKKKIEKRSQLRKQKPINKPEVNKVTRQIKQEITKWKEKQQLNQEKQN